MNIRTVSFSVKPSEISPTTPQWAGVAGENAATRLTFQLAEDLLLTNGVFRFQYADGLGSSDSSEAITPVGNTVSLDLPAAWTISGNASVRLVVTRDDVVVYTPAARLYFTENNEGEQLEEQFAPQLSDLINRTAEAAQYAENTADELLDRAAAGEFKGDTGAVGPRGEQGIQGVQGVQGIQGVQGAPGSPLTVVSALPTTLIDDTAVYAVSHARTVPVALSLPTTAASFVYMAGTGRWRTTAPLSVYPLQWQCTANNATDSYAYELYFADADGNHLSDIINAGRYKTGDFAANMSGTVPAGAYLVVSYNQMSSTFPADGMTVLWGLVPGLTVEEMTVEDDGTYDLYAHLNGAWHPMMVVDQRYSSTSENAQSGKAVGELAALITKNYATKTFVNSFYAAKPSDVFNPISTDTATSRSLAETFAGALRGTAVGGMVCVDDVSPVGHEPVITLASDALTDFSTVGLRCTGKNLLDPAANAHFVAQSDGSYLSDGKLSLGNSQFPLNLPAGVYTVSMDIKSAVGGNYRPCVVYADGTTREPYAASTGDYVHFSFTTNGTAVDRLQLSYGGSSVVQIRNAQVECGTVATAYEPYGAQTAVVGADGSVTGVLSAAPVMTLIPTVAGVTVSMTYHRDLTAAFNRLETAIAALGTIQ